MTPQELMQEINTMIDKMVKENDESNKVEDAFQKIGNILNGLPVEDCLAITVAVAASIITTAPKDLWPPIVDGYHSMLADALKFQSEHEAAK